MEGVGLDGEREGDTDGVSSHEAYHVVATRYMGTMGEGGMTKLLAHLNVLQQSIGYTFSETGTSLLVQAVTHASVGSLVPGFNNERLEFLGDAVISLLVAENIYETYPDMQEGEMTKLRSAVVSQKGLAHVARELQLGEYLLLGPSETTSNGSNKDRVLCCGFEALVAAIYLDGGLESARAFCKRFLIPKIHTASVEDNYKTLLQEFLLKQGNELPTYVDLPPEGPAHDRIHTSLVKVRGEVLGRGTSRRRRLAQQEAARQALDSMDPDRGPRMCMRMSPTRLFHPRTRVYRSHRHPRLVFR